MVALNVRSLSKSSWSVGTLTCGCTEEYRCGDCGECYAHNHEWTWRASEEPEDMGVWSTYGVEDILDSTRSDYVTSGTGCWHRVRMEK